MSSSAREVTSNGLILDCGVTLRNLTVAYETYGALNAEGTNAILICHALTGSAHAAGYNSPEDKTPGWWDGLIGPGKAFDTEKYFVVSSNILGSCYGTTGPTSINPETGEPYRNTFPQITVRDIVRVQKLLLDRLGVKRLVTICGSSLGGMQVLEWPLLFPEFVETIIPISTAARQPAGCIALNTAARAAITNDPEWRNGSYNHQPANGLSLARTIGMISYRSFEEFEQRFGRTRQDAEGSRYDSENHFEIERYLQHQGEKLVERFDANTYLLLSRATDLHDVTYDRGELSDVLRSIKAKTLCIGVSSDARYPVREQKEIVRHIPNARYAEVQSIHGHDAFLIEYDQLTAIIRSFLTT
ncbi:MAG TPA: homoserine O-acetyltransferase [Bacteroidota bacterium]|nr:homoserine O-acetyltransferase [Bacteroidota bacterium]